MALVARYLIDTSAASRMSNPEVARRLRALVSKGTVATTAALDAEAFAAVPGAAEFEQLLADRRATREYLPTNDEHWHAALGAQRALAKTCEHNRVDIVDLLTAALACAHKLTVVHYDAGFDTAATVLTFRHRWVMPRGTI
ncbi:twitching motility protein PilT [Mycobacterium asiaticum]|uniref:Ribonuclease VapC n=1 Tax=Mycobacterium asiaticum TaxID=1790 RepID=A0A1A3P523_MYCAS|nr:PIN domain-containing protein [Mycobacterium asiaticum]OBK27687.1 twitching motility protein PilT [Mycobacterium asiaticum]